MQDINTKHLIRITSSHTIVVSLAYLPLESDTPKIKVILEYFRSFLSQSKVYTNLKVTPFADCFQIGLIMGQLITRLTTDGIEKTDTNLDYETYGIEGECDYASDRNGDYQPSDYDDMDEKNDRPSAERTTSPKVRKTCSLF